MSVYTRRAQYHETDRMGVIHHSNYIKWMEEARTVRLEEMGINYASMEEAGILSPFVSLSVDYRSPVRYWEDVEISVSVRRYTGVVLELSYEFVGASDGTLRAKAESRHCFLKDRSPVSLKKAMPEVHEKLMELVQ